MTRAIVVDASVAVKWYVHERDRDRALELLDREDDLLIAPDIFLPEVVNALLRQNRQARFSDDLLEQAIADLNLTCPELIASRMLMERALELARALRHSVYDCLYLTLAERWNTVLVTADEEFVAKCRNNLSEPSLMRLRTLSDHRTS